eukprot:14496090-Alexandrium_andersonii.AAC.1
MSGALQCMVPRTFGRNYSSCSGIGLRRLRARPRQRPPSRNGLEIAWNSATALAPNRCVETPLAQSVDHSST